MGDRLWPMYVCFEYIQCFLTQTYLPFMKFAKLKFNSIRPTKATRTNWSLSVCANRVITHRLQRGYLLKTSCSYWQRTHIVWQAWLGQNIAFSGSHHIFHGHLQRIFTRHNRTRIGYLCIFDRWTIGTFRRLRCVYWKQHSSHLSGSWSLEIFLFYRRRWTIAIPKQNIDRSDELYYKLQCRVHGALSTYDSNIYQCSIFLRLDIKSDRVGIAKMLTMAENSRESNICKAECIVE